MQLLNNRICPVDFWYIFYRGVARSFGQGGDSKNPGVAKPQVTRDAKGVNPSQKVGGGGVVLVLQIRKVRLYATRIYLFFWYTEMAFPARGVTCVSAFGGVNNIFPIKSSFARQKGAWTVVLHKYLLMY